MHNYGFARLNIKFKKIIVLKNRTLTSWPTVICIIHVLLYRSIIEVYVFNTKSAERLEALGHIAHIKNISRKSEQSDFIKTKRKK